MKCNCYWCRRWPWVAIESLFLGSAITAAWLKDGEIAGIGIALVAVFEAIWWLKGR